MTFLIQSPQEISYSKLAESGNFSPSMYRQIQFPNSQSRPLKDCLDKENPFDIGHEPGSVGYIERSSHYLMRTKALQWELGLPYPKGDAIQPIIPRFKGGPSINKGDILLAKDSNIGDTAMVGMGDWSTYCISSGIVRLNPTIDRYYLYACLKHQAFKDQLDAATPKGATIRHSGKRCLDCLLPFPKTSGTSDKQMSLVGIMTCLAVKAEDLIRIRADEISQIISSELTANYSKIYAHQYPTFLDISSEERIDSSIYSSRFKEIMDLIVEYPGGFRTPSDLGFTVIPGPSLEIKIIKKRIDSDVEKPGYYKLYIPKNISEYGDMVQIPYLGTPANLPLLQRGDILIGEAGFRKGRSIVLLDKVSKATTNAHGLFARQASDDIEKSIFFRCIFDWYRRRGLVDALAVGGSGGHLSPVYFEYIKIPNFKNELIKKINRHYSSESIQTISNANMNDFARTISKAQDQLGIWQLSKLRNKLWSKIRECIDCLIYDEEFDVDLVLTSL